MFAGAAIGSAGLDSLVHFAASVFWRAAVRQWPPSGGHAPIKLQLGPYLEQLRLFLLDEHAFPRDAVLTVTVNHSTDAAENNMVLFPWLRNHKATHREYQLVVPGISFQLMVGRGLPKNLRSICTVCSSSTTSTRLTA